MSSCKADDCSSQPFLDDDALRKLSYRTFDDKAGEDDATDVIDPMTYSTHDLTTWKAFFNNPRTIWFKPELWFMMLKLFVVSLATCTITLLVVPDPVSLRVSKFTSISKFLNVVVGLLMGFFMASSMTRWQSCAQGFMELLDACRNMQVQFMALGVPEKDSITILRYGYASAWLLYLQLVSETKKLTEGDGKPEKMWEIVGEKMAHIDITGNTPLLSQQEMEVLKMTHNPSHVLWTWIGVLLGGLAQDGWIPAMASPTYGRIMNICQYAHRSMVHVRTAVSMQAPLTYCQTLATLVHVNSLISALTLGVVSGVAIGTVLVTHGLHFYKKHDAPVKEEYQDLQGLAVTFMYCFFGPLLYQALLLISMYIAQPFQSEDAAIPMGRLLHELETDMCHARDAVEDMGFKKPYFKEPPSARGSNCAGA
jgi:hypothetical protein